MGVSGRAILEALARGQDDPEILAGCVLVRARIRASCPEVAEALRGRLSDHQRLLLQIHLAQLAAIETAITRMDTEVGERLEPFSPSHRAADDHSRCQ
jgi:transposase